MTRYRVVVICTQFQPGRKLDRGRHFLQPVTGLQLAAQLNPARFDIRLYHEDWHGAFNVAREAKYDIAILTGLQADFDRMRQLSYWFRRAGTLVIAGGAVCSLFPDFATQFFDVVCVGGVEAVGAATSDYLEGRTKQIYHAAYLQPKAKTIDFRLLRQAGIKSPVHFIESSRGCRFKCSFCIIPAEGGGHATYSVDETRAAIDDSIASSPPLSLRRIYPQIVFLDNNFADDRIYLDAMLAMLCGHKRVRGWAALVTQNVLADHALIRRMAASKCRQLFVGLESLDPVLLRRFNKKQNLGKSSVVDDIAHAERCGISIGYGYLFDPRFQTVAAMQGELRAIASMPGMPMPLFLSLICPLVGTASFWDDVAHDRLAPNLRLRDLDGETVAFHPTASDPQALASFLNRLLRRPWSIAGAWPVLAKALGRVIRAGPCNPFRWSTILVSNFYTVVWGRGYSSARHSYMAGEDVLDPQYSSRPVDLTSADRARYFDPIAITDGEGRLMPWLQPYAPASITQPVLETT